MIAVKGTQHQASGAIRSLRAAVGAFQRPGTFWHDRASRSGSLISSTGTIMPIRPMHPKTTRYDTPSGSSRTHQDHPAPDDGPSSAMGRLSGPVLGIESSCDETGVAICTVEGELLAHALHSQIDQHALYGGVVPEIASRDHVRRMVPLVNQVLGEADLAASQLGGIGYTAGPGLAGALLTGATFGRSYAAGLGIPAISVHHMEGHLLSPLLEPDPPPFPFVCLLVSGGHTQLVEVTGLGDYRLLGASIDDAAGEAFDKTAKMLGLPYPGGAALSRLALEGDAKAIALPRPLLDRPGLDFSFSGLKTAVITRYREFGEARRADLAASFEAAVVDVLAARALRALKQTGLTRLVVAGGVSANRHLRERLASAVSDIDAQVWYPRLEFCTDNGAMIALAASLRLAAGQRTELSIGVWPRWPLAELSAPGRVS